PERLGLAGEGSCTKYPDRRIGARELRAFATAVSSETRGDVGRDAGICPAVATQEQIEPPALDHAHRVLDSARCPGIRSRDDVHVHILPADLNGRSRSGAFAPARSN